MKLNKEQRQGLAKFFYDTALLLLGTGVLMPVISDKKVHLSTTVAGIVTAAIAVMFALYLERRQQNG